MTDAAIRRGILNCARTFRSQPAIVSMYILLYNPIMLESIFQILAVYLFAAMPCFPGWIANGGKREDVGIPIVASLLLSLLFGVLILFFT
jgi:hypothetical protein